MNHTFKVPLIPQNLNKHETIVQIAEVLDHLSTVTNNIFKQINNRIDSSSNKLSDISERIVKVNVKINKLSGAKNATQVFSSCKYPAADLNQPYISVFSEAKPIELVRHKIKYKKVHLNDEPVDKLHIYHVKIKNHDKKGSINGLGEIPNDVDCISDLLLYNTGKNLYKNFVMSDALDVTRQVKEHEINNDSSNSIGAAPHSISERSTLTRSSTQNYFYTPNLGEVPTLDVPVDLPDLPGVADDLRYDSDFGPGIAPSSVTTTPNIPDLPAITAIDHRDSKEESLSELELPPPPTPNIEVPKIVEQQVQNASDGIEREVELPEPPVVVRTEENVAVRKLPELPQTDVRASLMEAIRLAGGAKKLKSTNEVKKEAPKSTGGDLMADLHAKLSMRRKGISGNKKQDNIMDASSALEKISAMIPPPTNNGDLAETNTEDEDWDD